MMLMGPRVERLALELGPLVDREALWQPAGGSQALEDRDNSRRAQAHIDFDHRRLARVDIDERQEAEGAPIGPRIA
jgi:hypothetical protein